VRDLFSPNRRTPGHYTGGAPPILYVLIFPWNIYFYLTKQERSKETKRELFCVRGRRFQYSRILLRFRNTLGRRMHSSRNLPYNKIWAVKHSARFFFSANGEHHKSRNIASLQRGGSLTHLLNSCKLPPATAK